MMDNHHGTKHSQSDFIEKMITTRETNEIKRGSREKSGNVRFGPSDTCDWGMDKTDCL